MRGFFFIAKQENARGCRMWDSGGYGKTAAFVRAIDIIPKGYPVEYKIIRSSRKTMALDVRPEGVIVRVPLNASRQAIEAFLQKEADWLREKTSLAERRRRETEAAGKLTEADIRALGEQALRVIPQRVRFYAEKIGVTYGRITIRNQRTKWGCCMQNGNLTFNCLLMLAPPEVLDSVVVHELCHRKEMNHSSAFYAEVLRVFPDYYKWNDWLRQNGGILIGRMLL